MEQSPVRYGAASWPQYNWTFSEPQPAGYNIRPRIKNRPAGRAKQAALALSTTESCPNVTHSDKDRLFFQKAYRVIEIKLLLEPNNPSLAGTVDGDQLTRVRCSHSLR